MDDREFFDHLYQLWSRTTGAEDSYWMPVQHDGKSVFYIESVAQDESRKRVASYVSDEDAEFITGIHGCLADLWRRLHAALDEADASDYDRDSREARIWELESEVADLRKVVIDLSTDPPWMEPSDS